MKHPFAPKAEHVQGSAAWLAHRKQYLGASDAATIMGLSPWSTPYKLWSEKVGLMPPPETNYAMQRGSDMEPRARAAFEKDLGVEVFPKIKYHNSQSFMMASLDGISIDEECAVEIKCPGIKAHTQALNGEVPKHYMPQLQHQLAVIGSPMIWYYSYDGERGKAIRVKRDEEFITKLIETEKRFWKHVEEFDPPPYTDRDYENKDDLKWISVSERVSSIDKEKRKLKEQIKFLDQERDALKSDLVEECDGRSCRCGDLTLARSFPKGRVNYSDIPELETVNLEQYRNRPKETWTLKTKK